MLAAAYSTSTSTSPGDVVLAVAVTLLAIAVYWLPAFVAWRRGVRHLGSVIVINFFGFLGVTWIIALAMALADPAAAASFRPET